MGYCSGAWFSDYNLREVQRFLEARPQPALATVQGGATAAGEIILVAGRIDAQGVSFEPVQRARGIAPVAATGAYRLRVRAAGGATFEIPFEPVEVDHATPAEQHFFAAMPSPGVLAGLEVTRAGVVVPQRADSRVRAQGGTAARPGAPAIQWQERGNRLELAWDDGAARFLSATHVLNGGRTVLAVNLSGGQAALDLASLPRGGEFEFSLSDGLNAHLFVVAR
jgi:hypothetical protein